MLDFFVGQVARPAPYFIGGVQPDVGNLPLLKTLFTGIRDVRFHPIRIAQGQGEEPDLRPISFV